MPFNEIALILITAYVPFCSLFSIQVLWGPVFTVSSYIYWYFFDQSWFFKSCVFSWHKTKSAYVYRPTSVCINCVHRILKVRWGQIRGRIKRKKNFGVRPTHKPMWCTHGHERSSSKIKAEIILRFWQNFLGGNNDARNTAVLPVQHFERNLQCH